MSSAPDRRSAGLAIAAWSAMVVITWGWGMFVTPPDIITLILFLIMALPPVHLGLAAGWWLGRTGRRRPAVVWGAAALGLAGGWWYAHEAAFERLFDPDPAIAASADLWRVQILAIAVPVALSVAAGAWVRHRAVRP